MLIFAVVILVALLAIVLSVSIIIPIFSGAPFVRTNKKAKQAMFELAGIKEGERVID